MRASSTTHLVTAVWAVLTGLALLWPDPHVDGLPIPPAWLPATAHVVLFLLLTIFLSRSLVAASQPQPLLAGFLLAFAYGMVLEIAQIAVEGRGAEWLDVAMNALGGLVAALTLLALPGLRGTPGSG